MKQIKTKAKSAALTVAGAAALCGIGWASIIGVTGIMSLLNI